MYHNARMHLFGSHMLAALVLTVSLAIYVGCTSPPAPVNTCTSDFDCDEGYCCSLSPMRYSYPQCRPMRAEGEVCRMGSETPLNLTLSYPNGMTLEMKGVHLVMCPCDDGLECNPSGCVQR